MNHRAPSSAPAGPHGPHRVARSVAWWSYLALCAETAFGSSGRWLEIGPLSVRMVLFVVCVAASIPLVVRDRHRLVRDPFLLAVGAFLVVVIASAVWGRHLGNAPAFILADVQTFAALLLVPAVAALRLRGAEVDLALRVMFAGALVLAAATVALHLMLPAGIDVNVVNDWVNARSLGGLADTGGGLMRIYFRSQIMLVPALLYAIWRLTQPDPARWALLAASGLVTGALALSLTRSLWLGTVVALLVLLVLRPAPWRRTVAALGGIAAATVAFFLVSAVAYDGFVAARAPFTRLDPALVVGLPGGGTPATAPTDPATAPPAPADPATAPPAPADPATAPPAPTATTAPQPPAVAGQSDAGAVAMREASLARTVELFRDRPLTGWGLGHNLDGIRNDGRSEYTYWDLAMKLGIGGFLIFLATFAAPAATVGWRFLRGTAPVSTASKILAAAMAGVAAASYFNPYLYGFFGIVLLATLVASVRADVPPSSELEGRSEQTDTGQLVSG